MKHRLDKASSTRPRRRVRIDANKKFAEVTEIAAAMKKDEEKASKAAIKGGEKAAKED